MKPKVKIVSTGVLDFTGGGFSWEAWEFEFEGSDKRVNRKQQLEAMRDYIVNELNHAAGIKEEEIEQFNIREECSAKKETDKAIQKARLEIQKRGG